MPFRTPALVMLAAALTACSSAPPRPHGEAHNDGTVVFSDKSGYITGLAADAGHVYVLDDMSPFGVDVIALSMTDGSSRTLAEVPDDYSAGGIVVDGSYVYFRTMGAVLRVPTAGGPTETLLQIPKGSLSPALAVDGQDLYLGSPSPGVLLGAIPKSGGALTELANDPDHGGNYTRSIAITPAHVWVAFVDAGMSICIMDSCGPPPRSTDLLRYSKNDGALLFDASKKDPVLVAARGGYVYFNSGYQLVRMPDQGGDTEEIADSIDYLELAGRSAYWAQEWTGYGPGGVGRVDLVTRETHSYAAGDFHTSALAVDANNVYWAAAGDVYRAAR